MTHSVVIHALMVSWYPRRRPINPTGDAMMDLDPWRSSCVVEVVEEAHEASYLMKKLWRSPWTHTWWVNGPWTLEGDDMVTCGWWGTWSHMSWCWHSLMNPLMVWYILACDGLGLEPTHMDLEDDEWHGKKHLVDSSFWYDLRINPKPF